MRRTRSHWAVLLLALALLAAAQAALASDHPVRVVDDGELVGIVDDDAILRVVVAEQAP